MTYIEKLQKHQSKHIGYCFHIISFKLIEVALRFTPSEH